MRVGEAYLGIKCARCEGIFLNLVWLLKDHLYKMVHFSALFQTITKLIMGREMRFSSVNYKNSPMIT